jgi:hypothetical protein
MQQHTDERRQSLATRFVLMAQTATMLTVTSLRVTSIAHRKQTFF